MKRSPISLLHAIALSGFLLLPAMGAAVPAATVSQAFRKAQGRYVGKFDPKGSLVNVKLPAVTKLPRGKGIAVVDVIIRQVAPLPDSHHRHYFRVTRAVVRENGKLVHMKGRLFKVEGGPTGGPGSLTVNVDLRKKRARLVNSRMAGSGAFGGMGGNLTGRK